MAAKARITQTRDHVPIVLPKAGRPLNPAHIALLELAAAAIVEDYLRECAEPDDHTEQTA